LKNSRGGRLVLVMTVFMTLAATASSSERADVFMNTSTSSQNPTKPPRLAAGFRAASERR
jgi:hypothetical protein